MLRSLLLVTLGLSILAPAAFATEFVPGEILVLPKHVDVLRLSTDQSVRSTSAAVSSVLDRHALSELRRVAPERAEGGGIWKLVSSDPRFDPVAAARELRATGEFRAVCPNYLATLHATIPNDPFVNLQWWVEHAGDEDSKLPEAWDHYQGSASTVIAVMDVGVDHGHPDLATKMWINPGETPGNLIDDDGNGYVDDLYGWDFGDGDNDPSPHPVLDPIGIDVGFHGTFVAGIAAAETDDGEGMAGTNWHAKIMDLKIVDTNGQLTLQSIASAFEYAADNGADVLSMSFSVIGEGVPEFFQALVDDATGAGTLPVASAGNDSTSALKYPAANDGVISVGGTDKSGGRVYFSSWGDWVDISAPATSIWSALQTAYPLDALQEIYYQVFFAYDLVNPYMYGDGTSFSTPTVAGVAAMVKGQNPGMTPQQIANHLVATGDELTTDHPIGVKLNAYAAVTTSVVDAPVSVGGGTLQFNGIAPNPFAGRTQIRFTLPQAAAVELTLYNVAGRKVRNLVRGSLPAGPHAVDWDGRGDGGRALGSGIYFARLQSEGVSITENLVLLR